MTNIGHFFATPEAREAFIQQAMGNSYQPFGRITDEAFAALEAKDAAKPDRRPPPKRGL